MSHSNAAVIDLTDESPPAHARPRASTAETNTHIRDWSSFDYSNNNAPRSLSRDAPAPLSASAASRSLGEPIIVGSDDEDDDLSFTITGQSEPLRGSHPLQRSLSSSTVPGSARHGAADSTSSLRFHDGIARGPHAAGSRIPQSMGILSSSSSARHPLLPQRRAAIPSASATAARRSGNSHTTASDVSLISRLGGDFSFGGLGFGTHYSMELLGSLLNRLQSNVGAGPPEGGAQRKVPHEYDPKWTHPYEAQPGFTHSIIEPPVDLDTYFDDKAVVTGPLPDTTPICPCCRHALVTGANGDQRIWVLPCGHVIDGRCIDQLSGCAPSLTDDSFDTSGADDNTYRGSGMGKGKGKAKAKNFPEDEPPVKYARTSTRSRVTTMYTDTAPTPTLHSLPSRKSKKPKRFECPVQGCGQKCTKEGGSKYTAWEVFV